MGKIETCLFSLFLFILLPPFSLYAEKPYNTTDAELIEEGNVRISFGEDGMLNGKPPVDRESVKKVFETAI